MANAAKQAVVFGVLKACLARRYVLPEVYDVMDKVGGLLVQSPSIPVRQQCASVLLQFLLDYPLGQKRLRQHLGFLLNNLQYPYPATREVVIELLHAVVTKFPVEVLTLS
jgi:U3 small nucleolar RNA-associated protein 20